MQKMLWGITNLSHLHFGVIMVFQILLSTSRLILRLPTEADSMKLQAFENRNMAHLSPWRVTAPELDHKTQIIKWRQECKKTDPFAFYYFCEKILKVK